MGIRKIVKDTFAEWRRNTWMIFLFSIMFVISIAALFLAPAPTYISLGGSFMRLGSIPDMTPLDIFVVVAAYLVSLFLFADAVTNINLLIKSGRTQNKVPSEVWGGLFKYALKIFFIYTIAVLLSFAVNIATFDSSLHNYVFPLLSIVIFGAIFFVPPAIVIDDKDTFEAVAISLKMLATKWPVLLLWAVSALVSLSAVEFVLFAIVPLGIAKYLVIAFNGLLLIPLLTIFQSEVYLEKYPLSP